MDFTNFAALEFAGVIRAERELALSQRKWLTEWRDLQAASKVATVYVPAPVEISPAPAASLKRAA